MRRHIFLTGAAFLVALSTAANSTSAAAKPPDSAPFQGTLATVNGDPMTGKELVKKFTERHGGHAKFLGGPQEARSFLNVLIDERLLLQEAYDLGLDKDEAVAAAVSEYERDAATAALVKSRIDDETRVTPEETKAVWEKSLDHFVQVRQIGVESRAEADEIRAAILSGADFETLARSCSKADSRRNGGNLMVNWGQFDPEWERVVFPLEPGEVSPVIETPAGFDVVVMGGRVDAKRPELDKVSEQLQSVIHERKLAARKKAFAAELFAKYHVAIQPLDRTPLSLIELVSRAPETVVATWDDGKLTAGETFPIADLREWARLPAAYSAREIDSRLRATINGPLIALEARNAKVAERADIAEEVAKYRETMMQKALFRDHIFKDVAVTEEETTRYFEQHRGEFVEPEQRHVAHIMLSSEADAKKVWQSLRSGADFEEVAAKSSRDYMTARSGGDLGWVTPDRVPKALEQVLTLGQGAFSAPLHSATAWHVVKVLEVKPKRQQALDEVREAVRTKALDAKKSEARRFWIEKLRAASKIEFDDKAIAEFVRTNQYEGPKAFSQH